MINDEHFIKYEQDLMNIIEKERFEEKLETSSDFAKEYKRFKSNLNSLSTRVEVNEQYFINLLPNVKRRIERQKSFYEFRKITYGFALVFIVIVIAFQSVNNKKDTFEYNFNEWFGEFTNEEEVIDELFTNVLSPENVYSLYGSNAIEYSIEEFNKLVEDENQNIDLGKYIDAEIVNEDFIQQFSEEQFNEVYSILINKKIL